MVVAGSDSPLSEAAVSAMLELEYLTQVLPDTPALPASTLMARAGLSDVDGEHAVEELERSGLVRRTSAGLAPTGKQWDGPRYVTRDTRFAYDLDDETLIQLPRSWTPSLEAVVAAEYGGDETLMTRLGLLLVIAAHAGRTEPVSIGALREWDRDPVDAVLNLIVDELLPDQPHLAEEVAEFRAYLQLCDIEAGMPAVIVAGR